MWHSKPVDWSQISPETHKNNKMLLMSKGITGKVFFS